MLEVRAPVATARPNADNDYADLKRLIHARGLMERQPSRYIVHGAVLGGVFLLVAVGLTITRSSWWCLAFATPAAFLFGQVGFMAHEAAHSQVFRSSRKNYWMSLLLFNLVLGASRGWWADKHNTHHGHPNRIGVDPDIDFSVLAFTPEQAANMGGPARLIMRHQANAIGPLLSLEAINIVFHSVRFVFARVLRNVALEIALMLAHWGAYVAGLMLLLGPGRGAAFIAVHQLLGGLYVGAAFLPNHIGMTVVQPGERMDFLRLQVLTARNMRRSRVWDYAFGVLTCQIEHHLFPTMPRYRLREAAPLVREFCRARGIAYREAGVLEAYAEVHRYLAAVIIPVRRTSS